MTDKPDPKQADKLRNIGPKSAAWLRQVGLRTREDLAAAGTVEAFMRVKRAGFKPTLNLLYAIEGALQGCHWQEISDERRSELILAADADQVRLHFATPQKLRFASCPKWLELG